METKQKKWYQSKTIWGIVFAALGFVSTTVLSVPSVGLPDNPDFTQLQAHVNALKEAKNSTGVFLSELVALFGTLVAIYGRLKADTKLTA